MFEIKTQSHIPIFEQLKIQILEYITAGVLIENEQLPSVRSLSSELGINPNTVAKAYSKLEKNKIIYKIPGKGCYITTKHVDELIKEEKISRFDMYIKELRNYHIDQNELVRRIERIYREEDSYVEHSMHV